MQRCPNVGCAVVVLVQREASVILWAVFHKGLKMESRQTPLIIRFIGTKTKINILANNLEVGIFVKIIRKG